MSSKTEERIVMTPVVKEPGHTVLRLERKKNVEVITVDTSKIHEAGGDHSGLVINKQVENQLSKLNGQYNYSDPISLSFKVYLVNGQTSVHTEEWRQLRFYFPAKDADGSLDDDEPCVQEMMSSSDKLSTAQSFFRDLVNPIDFPANYVNYILRIMKLMQNNYSSIKMMEIEMKQVCELSQLPSRPVSTDDSSLESKIDITEDKVLEMIESSYPTAITINEIAERTKSTIEEVHFLMQSLIERKIVKEMAGFGTFTRITENDEKVKLVKQMPKISDSQLEPTIAIITGQFIEKMAVDTMIDNKDTYVRYKMEGESNVYTLGNIAPHRVVSTKLPLSCSNGQASVIASGNSTTRLLGTFQRVDYVFIVGVSGGVPHFTDYNQHVRLGDVVVSTPPLITSNGHVQYLNNGANKRDHPYIYVCCEKNEKGLASPIHKQQTITPKNSPKNKLNGLANGQSNGQSNGTKNQTTTDLFTYKNWCPSNLELQEIAYDVHDSGQHDVGHRSWEHYLDEGLELMSNYSYEGDVFVRPNEDTDKLYMSIGSKDVIEVGHPTVPMNGQNILKYDARLAGQPVVHFGAIGSGRAVVKDENIRQDIATKFGIKAFDGDNTFDSVIESIYGNRKDKYIFIRGVCDYKDGTSKKSRESNWQPYAALSAAAFMKSVIMSIPVPIEEGTMV